MTTTQLEFRRRILEAPPKITSSFFPIRNPLMPDRSARANEEENLRGEDRKPRCFPNDANVCIVVIYPVLYIGFSVIHIWQYRCHGLSSEWVQDAVVLVRLKPHPILQSSGDI